MFRHTEFYVKTNGGRNLKINKSMSEKTYVFPEGNGSSLDPNIVAMMNGGGGFGGNGFNNPFWALVLLAFLRNNFGWGGDGNGSNCSAAFVSSQLGQAIAGNANALSNLSTHLDCSIGQVQTGIAALQSAIQSVAHQTGMSGMQVINAIQSGNTAIANQISQCCCDNKLLTTSQGYENRINNLQQSQLIQNGFNQIGYAAAEQTCAIKQNQTDNTSRVLAKLDAIEDSRKDREISSLTAALTAANSRAERQSELAPIYKALADIQCKQPSTFSVPYQPFTAIPNCVAYQMGLCGGFPYGPNSYGSIWS